MRRLCDGRRGACAGGFGADADAVLSISRDCAVPASPTIKNFVRIMQGDVARCSTWRATRGPTRSPATKSSDTLSDKVIYGKACKK